ncbi:SNW domain-containing protein 1-like isoform X2 [Varroa jacobsoni]|uniref:SKI-interacting protein SKIP SNW domain-containing protein n=1 Tax=Varroa destructor TaxID=109461 RepID=A0A7M7KYN9_VARDE|nr:SNW domain-containing protein 1-like isoform X2 [Varroa destructor]XP_022701735.1 SNW domain-containing protein 1-like isoform X2 [Varroa jacobsoni]
MAGLRSLLPAPTQKIYSAREQQEASGNLVIETKKDPHAHIPIYGRRRGWTPRKVGDYGDGGAYPEIQVAQYPLEMGKKKDKPTGNAITVQLDAQGKVKYDALLKQGGNADKVVYSKLQDLLPYEITADDEEELKKPDDEAIKRITEDTKKALEKLTHSKISAAMPVRTTDKQAPAQYIRYTPAQQGSEFNSGASQRIIRMVEAQKDPMEPPKYKINKKIPRGPPSPPPPVMHSPTRKVTVKEQQDWKIPPCVSNWKNAKGYTIPLDKRLAADGRGLQQQHINENFSKLAEALYLADRKAREAVEARAQLERKMAAKEKEKKEEHLRAMAQRARDQRAGIRVNEEDEDDEAQERDMLRQERHRERQRERNIARAAPDKRNRLERERERDISEKIALGLPSTSGTSKSGEVQFDQRLFNQSKCYGLGFRVWFWR